MKDSWTADHSQGDSGLRDLRKEDGEEASLRLQMDFGLVQSFGGKCITFVCYDLIDVNFTIFIS